MSAETGRVLEARALFVSRGERRILHGVDLSLAAGEAVALVGPNAAGKSTLVRALAGLLPVEQGEVTLGGKAFAQWGREAWARELALVTADDEGAWALTVRDRARLGRFPHRGPFRPYTRSDEAAVDRALAESDLTALGSRALHTLSAGERQLAALARGLAQEPRVLLLDEPAAHLDIGHQLRLFRVLDDVRARGVAVLAVVHDLPRAASWATRMIVLAGGRITAQGLPRDVLAGEALGRAFGVEVTVHPLGDPAQPFYAFREVRHPGR